MSRPVIGISTNLSQASWGVWDQPAALLPFNYILAIQRAGGMAVMVPPDQDLERNPDELLDVIDGLILAGGNDMDPSMYGAARHPETNDLVPERDRVELALTRRAVERDMPVLGICRGMQVLNVAMGGTLIQHLPDHVGNGHHRPNPGSFDDSDHTVRLQDGSLAAIAAGAQLHNTNSHHHQGIDRLGEHLVITGTSTLDDLPEAVEAPDRRFVLGVQWHPEADETSQVIATLVEQARDYRRIRGSE